MSVLFPVIGVTQWSRGGWMPNTKNHRGRTHAAIDIYADRGAPIIAPVSGRVKATGSTSVGGHWIQIEGDDGYVYYFAHMNAPTHLSRNDRVSGGQQMGAVGNSGSARTTSTHVHFSIKRNGTAVNPINMLENGVVVPNVGGSTGRSPESNVESWERGAYYGEGGGVPEDIPQGITPSEAARQGPEIYAYDQTPSTVQQFQQWQTEYLSQMPTVSPIKQRASAAVRSSLEGMAAMVRQYGFNTDPGSDTGIPEDIAQAQRKEVSDGTSTR